MTFFFFSFIKWRLRHKKKKKKKQSQKPRVHHYTEAMHAHLLAVPLWLGLGLLLSGGRIACHPDSIDFWSVFEPRNVGTAPEVGLWQLVRPFPVVKMSPCAQTPGLLRKVPSETASLGSHCCWPHKTYLVCFNRAVLTSCSQSKSLE